MSLQIAIFASATGIVNADANATANAIALRDSTGGVAATKLTASQQLVTAAILAGINAKTASYTLTATDFFVPFDATSGACVATLPAVAAAVNQILVVKKVDSSGNAVTLTPAGAETIDGASTKAISTQWGLYAVISDGTNWRIIFKI